MTTGNCPFMKFILLVLNYDSQPQRTTSTHKETFESAFSIARIFISTFQELQRDSLEMNI